MNNNELENRIKNLESMLFRVIDFMAIGADKITIYEFITYETVRRQLELDYILMEKTPASSFEVYCQHSLFQIENLLNYYYALKFKNKSEEGNKYFYGENQSEQDVSKKRFRVSEIPYGTKFTKFAIDFLTKERKSSTLNWNIQNIAYVRHSTVHRNSVDISSHEQDILKKYEVIKEKIERTKEEKELYALGVKVLFKQNSSFSLVKKSTLEFIEIIKPLIEVLQMP
jgi:hypothetical protein